MNMYSVNAVCQNNKKYIVTIEGAQIGQVTFSLYPSEIKHFNLYEGGTLSESDYSEISTILKRRGRERALFYLKDSDKTVYQMRNKLRENRYPEEIIESVIYFLEEYGYLNDRRFARNYVSYYKTQKSFARIRSDLHLKGISRQIIDSVLCEAEASHTNEQYEQIRRQLSKKIHRIIDDKSKQKVFASLMRKGFRYEDIISAYKDINC